MIVPEYWAEGRIQDLKRGAQVTIRRFGWSDVSQADAQANADRRAKEAFAKFKSGEKIVRREPKVTYNGAEGMPIREEIVARHGSAVITRNLYGARCLNTPNVLFADIDFHTASPIKLTLISKLIAFGVCVGCGIHRNMAGLGVVIGLIAAFCTAFLTPKLWRACIQVSGGSEKIARRRLEQFIQKNPEWHLRLYRTPAGFRVLAMHRTFDPKEPAAQDFFKALGTDGLYVRMCVNQHCFRARVSPKPWRIGIDAHIKPRPGIWPISPERMPERRRWIEAYEQAANNFASCEFLERLGSSAITAATESVQKTHDELSRATSGLPIA